MKIPRTSRRRSFRKPSPKRAAQFAAVVLLWVLWSLFSPDFDGGQPADQPAPIPPSEVPVRTSSVAEGRVRVCTWNVRNYSVAGRKIGGKYVQSPKPEAEKTALRKSLAAINADVLLIDEMGDAAFLRELRDDLAKFEGLVYEYTATTRYDSPSRVAIMSRIKPEKFVDCCDIKFEFKGDNRFSPRGTLGACFDVRGVKWYAFAVHLKSPLGARKSDEKFTPFRFAELRAISARIKSETGGCKNVIVAGDFNQEPSDALLRNIRGMVLVPQSDDDGREYTYFWSKKNIFYRYDFFLFSKPMLPFLSGAAAVWKRGGDASDHRPVYVDLDFSKN